MTNETKETKEETLVEMKKRVKELEQELEEEKKKTDLIIKRDEGYLVWTKNPAYDGMTAGLTFTDGMAFVRSDRKFPGYGNGSSEYFVNYLKNDFGYDFQFFTKDDMDELQKRLTYRARERKEIEAKIGTQSEMLEKLLQTHQL